MKKLTKKDQVRIMEEMVDKLRQVFIKYDPYYMGYVVDEIVESLRPQSGDSEELVSVKHALKSMIANVLDALLQEAYSKSVLGF